MICIPPDSSSSSSSSAYCWYHSRAHPRPIPEYAVTTALDNVLEEIGQRRRKRELKWKRNNPNKNPTEDTSKEESNSKSDATSSSSTTPQKKKTTTFPQLDETIELALNLNLDPRKPGQALRGSLILPHGTGKTLACMVFTEDESLAQQAIEAGARHAGGAALVDQVQAGDISLDSLDRCLATPDVMPVVSRSLARLLGPRGLYPNAKVGTLVEDSTQLLDTLSTQLAGKEVTYRTEKEGIVHVPVGKGSMGAVKLIENIEAVLTTVFQVKPEQYGKGKSAGGKRKKGTAAKKTKAAKYLLRASLSSTQGKGWRLDLRTVDPSSAFFLTSGEEGSEMKSSSSSSSDTAQQDTAAA